MQDTTDSTKTNPMSDSKQNYSSVNNESSKSVDSYIKWTDSMVKLLLVSLNHNEELFDKRKILSKKQIYHNISLDLAKENYNVSLEQVASKIKNLESSYKKKLLNKSSKKTGRNPLFQVKLFICFLFHLFISFYSFIFSLI